MVMMIVGMMTRKCAFENFDTKGSNKRRCATLHGDVRQPDSDQTYDEYHHVVVIHTQTCILDPRGGYRSSFDDEENQKNTTTTTSYYSTLIVE